MPSMLFPNHGRVETLSSHATPDRAGCVVIMDTSELDELRRIAAEFRSAIEQTRAERITPQLPYFPEGACRLVSRLLALHLSRRGDHVIEFISGRIPGFDESVRHTWLVVDGAVVDLTADPFGEPAVVVGAATPFHESLDAREERHAPAVLASFSEDEASRYRRLLAPIEARMPGFTPPAPQ
jgi:hypothetical protein